MNIYLDDKGDYACPTGTEKCSSATSDESTVCYPIEEHQQSCPITEIRIMSQSEKESSGTDFEYVPYGDETYLSYSKKVGDNLALTTY